MIIYDCIVLGNRKILLSRRLVEPAQMRGEDI